MNTSALKTQQKNPWKLKKISWFSYSKKYFYTHSISKHWVLKQCLGKIMWKLRMKHSLNYTKMNSKKSFEAIIYAMYFEGVSKSKGILIWTSLGISVFCEKFLDNSSIMYN